MYRKSGDKVEKNIDNIIARLKNETNNLQDIVYRMKKIRKKQICIIYNEPLTSSDKISDFILRSLNKIAEKKHKNLIDEIVNDINNFKVSRLSSYDDLCFYLHRGFTIILIDDESEFLALETKSDLGRSISTPDTENAVRGSKDAFVEEYQKNIGLIKKRIKSNDLWIDNLNIGKYTKTSVGIIYINGIVKKDLVDKVTSSLNKINIDGIIDSSSIKNLLAKENKMAFPTIITTERPDLVTKELLEGKVVIVVDNSPFVILVPSVLNDFFKTSEDSYGKSINVTFTRIIKVMAFWISLLTPAIYISLITYNQEMVPTQLLTSFAMQREGVPFPAFFEAFIMMSAFEMLRESDLRVPSFTGSSLSIVGALILGDAAVNAGIVSPIMIIVISLTAISSLPFNEAELINAIRIYRLLFMIGASFMGIVGVVIAFILFITHLASSESFGKPYLLPYAPTDIAGIKDSIFKSSLQSKKERSSYLSNNSIRQGD